MRHWISPLLLTGVLILGVAVFVLERRVAGLERQLQAAGSGIAAVQPIGQIAMEVAEPSGARSTLGEDGTRLLLQLPQQGLSPTVRVPSSAIVPQLERQPSGVINGIPYYTLLLSDSGR